MTVWFDDEATPVPPSTYKVIKVSFGDHVWEWIPARASWVLRNVRDDVFMGMPAMLRKVLRESGHDST